MTSSEAASTPDPVAAALVARAVEARARAYAPYSKYAVGAAIRTKDGSIFVGVNVENASYGLTVCAERSATFAAVTAGHREFDAIAVVTENGASMCGACRQVVAEFVPRDRGDMPVYLAAATGEFHETSVAALLPGAFSGDFLADSD